MSRPRFGTAGQSESFAGQGYKKMTDVPDYLQTFGLNAFEYQSGRGVRLAEDTAVVLKEKGLREDILYSIHAPYYISMASMEEEKRMNSLRYVRESAAAIRALGGTRVIFHPGSCGKQSRELAMEKTLDTMQRTQAMLDEEGFGDITLCPETMGKMAQLGNLEEVLQMCQLDKRITPCIDFGHLNARTLGSIQGKKEFAAILDAMEDSLQDERASQFHVHFSKIEYSAGGEKRHLTFEDTIYGPQFEPFIELLYERKLAPVIICESAGTQAEDAKTMMSYYNSFQ